MDLLLAPFLGTPVWMWLGFVTLVFGLLALDLGVFHSGDREIGVAAALRLSAFYILVGLAFGAVLWWERGGGPAALYLTAFLVEKSLAVDNLFVIAAIFSYFTVPRAYQHRVLVWGVLGVIVLRGLLIGFGTALIAAFAWVLPVFAGLLVVLGLRMLREDDAAPRIGENLVLRSLRRVLKITDRPHGRAFFVRLPDPLTGRRVLFATPLVPALVMIELADVIFAVDSIPAVLAITSDAFVVYTSNIFAILGLRALYFALAAIMHRLHRMKYALAVLLVFIGAKVLLVEAMGWEKLPEWASLSITLGILGGGVAMSLWRSRRGQR